MDRRDDQAPGREAESHADHRSPGRSEAVFPPRHPDLPRPAGAATEKAQKPGVLREVVFLESERGLRVRSASQKKVPTLARPALGAAASQFDVDRLVYSSISLLGKDGRGPGTVTANRGLWPRTDPSFE